MTKNKASGDIKSIVQETIKELLNDEEFVNRIISKVTDRLKVLEEDVKKIEKSFNQLENKIINIQQNEKVNNVCIYNLEEEQGEKLTEKILRIFNENVKIPTRKEDVVKCYRIGNKNTGKYRPIVVKLERYQHKLKILKNAYNLKGTKIGISEELVRSRLELYKMAVQTFTRRNVFTRNGNIFIKREDTNYKITNKEELDGLTCK